jgi:hypothetical protein
VAQGSGDSDGENRRLNGVEFLSYEIAAIPLISVPGCLGSGLELASCDTSSRRRRSQFGEQQAASIARRHPASGPAHIALRQGMSMLARRWVPTLEKWA